MNCPRPHLYFSSLPRTAVNRHPHVLLVGSHQPRLLKSLEGWPKHWPGARNFLIKFASPDAEALAQLPSNGFDLVVVGGEVQPVNAELIEQLVRVARQGLISLC
ncbi:class I SAM-dependent methyltransferase [Aquipseudomonas campi]|uniref:Class I SAM-dependent methyltransferase n=1 Tax=Aquipseudomonas campi TaxID=2731681 RepID=A0A6M8FG10_9GAMM|nr:class I SAM-dependent methyltransferase [Pseudomonas campi]QKE63192.1 class I SAM-dependent methyltransferase [Pseudomonas campi]